MTLVSSCKGNLSLLGLVLMLLCGQTSCWFASSPRPVNSRISSWPRTPATTTGGDDGGDETESTLPPSAEGLNQAIGKEGLNDLLQQEGVEVVPLTDEEFLKYFPNAKADIARKKQEKKEREERKKQATLDAQRQSHFKTASGVEPFDDRMTIKVCQNGSDSLLTETLLPTELRLFVSFVTAHHTKLQRET